MNRLLLTLFFFVLTVFELLAGPGGQIAKRLFTTPLGKIVLVVLIIVLFPLLAYAKIRETIGIKKSRKDLAKLATQYPQFDWFNLKNRTTEIFTRVHQAWSREDLSEAADWMTDWYWQNQQLAYLEKWESKGLVNHTDVYKINAIKPLYLGMNSYGNSLSGSRVVMKIDANMEDYLCKRSNGQIVEGKRGYFDTVTVWTLVYENGKWLVENIEPDTHILAYANLKNVLDNRVVTVGS